MSNILYIIALVLIVLWAVGYFGFNAGQLIHILVVVAILALLIRIITGERFR